MTIAVLAVDLAALALVFWIIWYFWGSKRAAGQANVWESGVQEIYVRVKGGYDPDRIAVQAGRPVRLLFNRQETAACSEMVQFPDFGISRALPTGETVAIEIPAPKAGEYPFSCQMGMLRGTLVARHDGRPAAGAPGGEAA
ncbi:MAG: cupredoxin domain-containing protein [Candidatus Palauibacterales bacterium]|nr:cupredoxin domain-containing protein [Candidatus Palauibacterales bacterium]MDP2528351.1 cupredoxin domain-containing protein [Candidatus Palauibacterales bacterium]MDP2584389.1 cupredoxin domain-containing protein [Candidatus Palauibacterales bacterium]